MNNSNVWQALKYMQEAARSIEAVKMMENPFMGEATVNVEYHIEVLEEARLESLLGQVFTLVSTQAVKLILNTKINAILFHFCNENNVAFLFVFAVSGVF